MPQAAPPGLTAEYRITRIFDAPRAVVFEAWTDPRRLVHWWGPHEVTNPICDLDPRPGGTWRIVMRTSEGDEFPLSGMYLEVAEPERLRMTVDCAECPPEWHALADGATCLENKPGFVELEVLFENLDGRTKLTVSMRFESTAARDAVARAGLNEGWSESLESLAAYLAGSC